MEINGKEIKFSIFKKSDALRMDAALKRMEKTEEKIKESNNYLQMVDMVLEMFRDFFLDTTGEDVVGDCDDLMEAKKMYEDFLNMVAEQKKNFMEPFSVSRVR